MRVTSSLAPAGPRSTCGETSATPGARATAVRTASTFARSVTRTFVGALRAVVEVRDRHCQHPSGCDEPIDGCDVDHIVPWSHGGVTSQDNGRLLCRYHNRIESQHPRPPNTGEPDDTGDWPVVQINFTELHTVDVNELLA